MLRMCILSSLNHTSVVWYCFWQKITPTCLILLLTIIIFNIGLADFIPNQLSGTSLISGRPKFELFEGVLEQASHWIHAAKVRVYLHIMIHIWYSRVYGSGSTEYRKWVNNGQLLCISPGRVMKWVEKWIL